jgi:hypothetical protein
MNDYVPSRTCPCTRCKASELLAPALLVSFGVLVLVGNLHLVSFGRTWPLMLIVLGGIRVLQATVSAAGHRGPGLQETPPAEDADPASHDIRPPEVTP